MQIAVTFRHREPDEGVKDYVKEKVEKLEKYLGNPTGNPCGSFLGKISADCRNHHHLRWGDPEQRGQGTAISMPPSIKWWKRSNVRSGSAEGRGDGKGEIPPLSPLPKERRAPLKDGEEIASLIRKTADDRQTHVC